MRVAVLLLLQKPGLCGVAIETDGEKGNLLNYFIFRELLFLEVIDENRDQLYLIKDLTLINPQMFRLFIDRVKQVDVYLRRDGSKLSPYLRLFLEGRDAILLEEGQFEILGVTDQMIENRNAVYCVLCLGKVDKAPFLSGNIFGHENAIEVDIEPCKRIID